MPSPESRYRALVAQGEIRVDPEQERVVLALEALFQKLSLRFAGGAGKSGKVSGKNLFSFLGRKSQAADIRGIYIYGSVGRGKSMLMDLFYDALPEDMPKRRAHFHEFMIGVHDFIHSWRQGKDARKGQGAEAALFLLAAQIAQDVRVLCFDEFHVTDIADAMILGRLFRGLFERGVVVVATSNWPPERLYEGGLQRDRFLPFIALLKERMEVLHLNGASDYRSQFITQEGSYFSPLGKDSALHADRLFEKLTGQAVAGEEHLVVRGRDIIVQAARGVARFTFSQLCEQPHGAEDYLKIAQAYHTVFLENVPKLGYDRRNEAKRLMTLIDAFYEAGTRLIVTADAPPEKLYRGHDHAFEFERTVSRLKEMQSAEYIARW